ncbi:hypothetical protein SAZ11_32570 [Streptomyces sp. FXJ1.4098]|uniref:hypothetical protein n=1 Tax=Streptomyces sp. NPDC020845 TaxID=3365096 RepID=UPI002998AB3A|nr:hypothetical protein [Streptomyces sp. FXJ1.4098]
MADIYDLILSVNLPDTLSDAEISELRWHLGLAPQPATPLSLVTDYAEPLIGDDGRPEEDEQGNWLMSYEPYPVLAAKGPAHHAGGVLLSALEPETRGGWALTSRQEFHPDELDRVDELLLWLHERAVDSLAFQCHVRFYEEDTFAPVSVTEGEVNWP